MTEDMDYRALARRFDAPGVRAIVLMGSLARGDAGPFSDVDLVCLTDPGVEALPGEGSHLIEGRLVVVSRVSPAQVEEWFTRPEITVQVLVGVRRARALIDREGAFAAAQARALAFTWDSEFQRQADAQASREMVGWIEEVHKGLEGLRRDDVGRMLHGRFGCTWGLARVMCVQRGILLTGDNTLYDQVTEALGRASTWSRLLRTAYGIARDDGQPPTLREQVIAGLRLYALTAQLIAGALRPEDAPLVAHTVGLIEETLGAL
jgi:predicted nucleotidyltransferase